MTTTGLFIASMTAALGLLHYLGSAAMGDAGRAQIRSCAALLLLVVVLMTGTLRQMRGKAWTAPPATVKVVPAGVK
jgi:uncharacterized membrane protein YtjA (UPF0391 family)